MRLSLLFAAFVAGLLQQPSAERLMQSLNEQLLNSRSATATLETWCRDYRLAPEPKIVALLVPGATRTASAETRARLNVKTDADVKYRRVELRCGDKELSEAENWYVPSRLTLEMNRLLETTDTPFGRAVAALDFYRKTVSTRMLWSGKGAAPEALFEHRAVLYTRDHVPFAEVVEVYQRQILPQ